MARIPENQLRALGFSKGINNVAEETDLTGQEVREAVNVDITAKGSLLRRDGYTQVLAGDCHSLFAAKDYMVVVRNDALTVVDAAYNTEVLRTGMTPAPVSYAEAYGEIYWSNEIVARRITTDLTDAPFWIDMPSQPAVTAVSTGGFAAGTYQVAVTMVGDTGMESGSPTASVVEVPEGGGIMLSGIVLSEGAAHARVYRTDANGDVLYFCTEVPAAATAGLLSSADELGRPLVTQFLRPLPAGQFVRFWNGRILVASGDTLWFSEALRGGLCSSDNYVRFAGRITLLEIVGEGEEGSGLYVGDGKRVYFLAGANPKEWARRIRFMHPAVEGSGVVVSGSLFADETEQPYTGPVAVWVAQNGVYCLGMPGGSVRTIREDSVALPEFSRAAMLLREKGGRRQIIGSFSGGDSSGFAVADSVSATVRRHGKTLD